MRLAQDAALAIALALLISSAGAAYSCPASCNASPSCQCASPSPPGGLKPADAPQFIVLTNDDAVSIVTYPVIRNITDRHKNANGCVMPATWFVTAMYTDCDLVRQLYMDNHEIATHTLTHPGLPNATEIVGCRTWLNQTCNVPLEKLRGFRAPFLLHDTQQRNVLRENGFMWDSSITDLWPSASSPSANEKMWPFTLDSGIPIDCTLGTGTCDDGETQPGLWEFPMENVQDEDGSVIASMDAQGDNFAEYQREFERNYYGNRAPLGIFLHAGLLMAFSEHQDQLNRFLDWALTHEDVWLVTTYEVLRWMKDPVPASQYELDCTPPTDMILPGGHLCSQPSGGCGQGTWNSTSCACMCLYQTSPQYAGFCPDSAGTCTVSKLYDFNVRAYYCPGTPPVPVPVSPSPAASPSPSPSSPAQPSPSPASPSPLPGASPSGPVPSSPTPGSPAQPSPSPQASPASPPPSPIPGASPAGPVSPSPLTSSPGPSPTPVASPAQPSPSPVTSPAPVASPGQPSPSPAVPSPSPLPSASPSPADPGVISLAMYITGVSANSIQGATGTALCSVVARVALQDASQCAVTSASDATPVDAQELRTLVKLAINTNEATQASLALQSAIQYGALGTALKSAGIHLDSVASVTVGSPSPAPLSPCPPSPSSPTASSPSPPNSAGSVSDSSVAGESSDSGLSGGAIGGIVGGTVGGVLLLAVILGVAIFLVRRRRMHASPRVGPGAVSMANAAFEPKPAPVQTLQVLASSREGDTYSTGTPRGTVTPRHAAVKQSSEDAARFV